MQFEWDTKKNELNIKNHQVSFEEACVVFADKFALTLFDKIHSKTEDRWITLGQIPNGNIILIIYTIKETEKKEIVRIISARKATKKEMKQYFQRKGGV